MDARRKCRSGGLLWNYDRLDCDNESERKTMKPSAELQARLEELWHERKTGARNFEIVELIEEILRLREENAGLLGIVKLYRDQNQ